MANNHTNIDFTLSDVAKLHDSCFITGKIITINKSSNSADVHTERYGRVNAVKFHYHCDGYDSPIYAYTAFKDDDDVKLLCFKARSESGTPEMKIVGFTSGDLMQCLEPVLIYIYGNSEKKLYVSYFPPDPPPPPPEEPPPPKVFKDGDTIIADSFAAKNRKVENSADSLSGVLYGEFAGYNPGDDQGKKVYGGDISRGKPATVNSCIKRFFKAQYEMEEVFAGSSWEKLVKPEDKSFEINSPVEFPPHSDMPCDYKLPQTRAWFKTYKYITVSAFVYTPSESAYPINWGISATYLGKPIFFDGGEMSYGCFQYEILQNNGSLARAYIGFDAWMEGDEYYIGAADNGGMYVFQYDQKKKIIKLVESYGSSAQKDFLQKHTNSTLWLVGYAKRKRYWCDFKSAEYYTEDREQSSLTTVPSRIIDFLFNQVTDEFWYCCEPFSTVTHKQPTASSMFLGAYTYYPSYYCETLIGNPPAVGCLPFIGKPKAQVVLVGGTVKVPVSILCYYTDPDLQAPIPASGSTFADNVVYLETAGTITDLGILVVGGNNYPQGTIVMTTGSNTYFHNTAFKDYSSHNDTNYDNASEKKLICWAWDPRGGFAYEVSSTKYSYKPPPDDIYFIDPETTTKSRSGDVDLIETASAFPHDVGWRAILKYGEDRKGYRVSPIVVYNNFAISADGHKLRDYINPVSKYSVVNRRFFTTMELKRKP